MEEPTREVPVPYGFPYGRRIDCEAPHCSMPAVRRRLFLDEEGFWTWLCLEHLMRVVGWRT